jgi:hypothetical protein
MGGSFWDGWWCMGGGVGVMAWAITMPPALPHMPLALLSCHAVFVHMDTIGCCSRAEHRSALRILAQCGDSISSTRSLAAAAGGTPSIPASSTNTKAGARACARSACTTSSPCTSTHVAGAVTCKVTCVRHGGAAGGRGTKVGTGVLTRGPALAGDPTMTQRPATLTALALFLRPPVLHLGVQLSLAP